MDRLLSCKVQNRDGQEASFSTDSERASGISSALSLEVPFSAIGQRLDVFLSQSLKEAGHSREKIKKLIQQGHVLLDGKICTSPKTLLPRGSALQITLPEVENTLIPEEGDLEIIYQDASLLVVNKPAGLTVHPCPSCRTGTLVHRLLARFPELAGLESNERPGIVHRLDKDTSGLMLVALTEKDRLALSSAFANREVHKEYLTLVHGVPEKEEGVIDAPIGRHPTHKTRMAVLKNGNPALSEYRILYKDPSARFCLLAVRIHTGRTHQIRVHMAWIGHPIVGEKLYIGKAEKDAEAALGVFPARQLLHAWRISFKHPASLEYDEVESYEAEDPDFDESEFAEHAEDYCCEDNFSYAEDPNDNDDDEDNEDIETDADEDVGEEISGDFEDEEDGEGEDELSFCHVPPDDFAENALAMSFRMQRVVLTGLPGCGKSTVLESLKAKGIATFSADQAVRGLYEAGADGWSLLRSRYGNRFVVDENSPVDKELLFKAMCEEPHLRREVEAMVHPQVFHLMEKFWEEQEKNGQALAVAEVPLYFESLSNVTRKSESKPSKGAHKNENHPVKVVTVGVNTPAEIRKERLKKSRGWDEDMFAIMEFWQMPEAKKMAACTFLVDNSRSPEELEAENTTLLQKLEAARKVEQDKLRKQLEKLWSCDNK